MCGASSASASPRAPDTAQAVAAIAPTGRPYAAFTLDDCGHDGLALTDRALRAGARLAREISAQSRAPAPLAQLGLGLDASSSSDRCCPCRTAACRSRQSPGLGAAPDMPALRRYQTWPPPAARDNRGRAE